MRMISWKRCLMQSLAVMTALAVFTYNTVEAQVVPGSGFKLVTTSKMKTGRTFPTGPKPARTWIARLVIT